MFEAIHSTPVGSSTIARMALTASEYGYDGIVVRSEPNHTPPVDPQHISDTYNVALILGVELHPDNRDQASGLIGSVRPHTPLVLIQGNSPEMNRFAVTQSMIDVLSLPNTSASTLDHVMVKTAKENDVHIELNFGPVLRTSGGRRVRAIQALQTLHKYITTYDAPYVISATPASHLQLRAPRELIALGETIGFDAEELKHGLTQWNRIAERNREQQTDTHIADGVHLTQTTNDQ